jgi:hypothetical protein
LIVLAETIYIRHYAAVDPFAVARWKLEGARRDSSLFAVALVRVVQ